MSNDGPIIVRKKRSDGEEEHHGGVWKLAFADFMTAMMAFFLVMWLINSTSKETKAVIVQYFNPVQLVDSTNAHKGLRDPTSGAQGKSATPSNASENTPNTSGATPEALYAAPIDSLDKIAKEQRDEQLRDPFDRSPRSASKALDNKASAERGISTDKEAPLQPPAGSNEKVKAAAQFAAEIEKVAKAESRGPKVEIKQTEEGLLISLTDDANFSMFDIGSIIPKPQLVRTIGEIGRLLATRPGEVEVRGHTDSRSFAGKSYDNWRLSSDRAGLVNYMLVRGGLPPARIGRIVGFADRRLKTPQDPLAPVNRRIEILLRGPGP